MFTRIPEKGTIINYAYFNMTPFGQPTLHQSRLQFNDLVLQTYGTPY